MVQSVKLAVPLRFSIPPLKAPVLPLKVQPVSVAI